jgi:hypothetical protein
VKALALSIAICLAVSIVVGTIWLERRHLACQRRSAAFARQIEDIERDSIAEIKVGAGTAEVKRFFEKRGIQVFVTTTEATGTIYTSGCSPFGCGTDEALIGVRVKLNPQGIVIGEPQVVSLYTNCL